MNDALIPIAPQAIVMSVAQARVWPQMGNARRFVDPNA